MAKKVKLLIKLQAPAGQANPASLGSTLGPAGINIMEFCKAFNAHTDKIESGTPIPAEVTVFEDRSFTFITKQPPVSFFLKKMAKITKGSSLTGRQSAGKISKADIEKIIELKKPDLNSRDLAGAYNMIKGSALSMGLEVEE
ncbi:50S ribosomal protein L11 [Rickettsiales bacterium LUAb2]